MHFSFAKASRYGLQALESRPLAWAAKIVNEYHRQLHHHLEHDDHNHHHHDRHHVDHQLRDYHPYDHHHLDHNNHDHQPHDHHYHYLCLFWSFDHLWWRCYSEFLIVMKVIIQDNARCTVLKVIFNGYFKVTIWFKKGCSDADDSDKVVNMMIVMIVPLMS